MAIAGVTAGNMWQLFAKFRGSRGSTTVAWALLVAAPLMLLVLFGLWLAAILILRRNMPATRVLHASLPLVFGLMQGLVDICHRRCRHCRIADPEGAYER